MNERTKLSITREIRLKTDGHWSISIQREPDGSVTFGLIWGNKDYLTHAVTISSEEFQILLDELA